MNIAELKNRIVSANKAYRAGTAVIADAEYDALLEEYKKLVDGAEFKAFADTLHEKAGKRRLPYVIGSLNKLKCSEPDTIMKFVRERAVNGLHVSAKVDGISAVLHYEKGRLTWASTRGDGYFGEPLDDKIGFVKGVVAVLPEAIDVDVRGELVILKDDFKSMTGFSNPRNACAGIMNRKRSSKEWNDADLGTITFVPYTILGDAYSKAEQFDMLEQFGFGTAWHVVIDPAGLNDRGGALVDELFKYATQDLPYEIDGVVVSDSSYRNEDEYRPEAQMAVKTNTLSAETTLIDVEWEGPSKDGRYSPIGVIEPVELGGAVISRCTLNNIDYIESLGAKYGSRVVVSKRGDIIPAIDAVVENPAGAKTIAYPDKCRCCGSDLVRDGVHMRCVNPDCSDQNTYKVEFFIKKLGVMNASFKSLKKFGISKYGDLLSFKADPSRKSETKFEQELADKMFSRSETDLFCAMSIRDVGETLQRKIIDKFGWDAVKAGRFEGGLPDGIGEITFDKFRESYAENLAFVSKIVSDTRYRGVESAPKKKSVGSVCFTGALNTMGRSEASKMAENAGFEVKSSVTKGLTYLVTNDKNSGSSKNEKAKKLGTKIIDETEFIKLMSGNTVESDVMGF